MLGDLRIHTASCCSVTLMSAVEKSPCCHNVFVGFPGCVPFTRWNPVKSNFLSGLRRNVVDPDTAAFLNTHRSRIRIAQSLCLFHQLSCVITLLSILVAPTIKKAMFPAIHQNGLPIKLKLSSLPLGKHCYEPSWKYRTFLRIAIWKAIVIVI